MKMDVWDYVDLDGDRPRRHVIDLPAEEALEAAAEIWKRNDWVLAVVPNEGAGPGCEASKSLGVVHFLSDLVLHKIPAVQDQRNMETMLGYEIGIRQLMAVDSANLTEAYRAGVERRPPPAGIETPLEDES